MTDLNTNRKTHMQSPVELARLQDEVEHESEQEQHELTTEEREGRRALILIITIVFFLGIALGAVIGYNKGVEAVAVTR